MSWTDLSASCLLDKQYSLFAYELAHTFPRENRCIVDKRDLQSVRELLANVTVDAA